MLDLNPTLAAAQNSLDRRPLCRLISSKLISSIPFAGNYFNDDETDEQHPDMIETASGRLAIVLTGENKLIYRYSDPDKLMFFDAQIASSLSGFHEASIVELDSSLGVLFIEGRNLKWMEISESGAILTSPTLIESYASGIEVREVHVIRLQDESFLALYRKSNTGADPDEHYLMSRTSNDFETWSAEAAVTLTGLSDTRRKSNPNLVQVDGGDIILSFDYVTAMKEDGSEITNIFHCISGDSGETFSTPEQITDEDEYGRVVAHPYVAQAANGSLTLAYYQKRNVLTVTDDTPGWCTSSEVAAWDEYAATDIYFDSTRNKIIFNNIRSYVGEKNLFSVVVMDVDTWKIEKCYSADSTPAFSSYFAHRAIPGGAIGGGKWACVNGGGHILVIDTEAEAIRTYSFVNNATYSLTKNIHYDKESSFGYAWVDEDADRLYLYGRNYSGVGRTRHWVGYIDLTEEADPTSGMYTFHEVFYDRGVLGNDAFRIAISDYYVSHIKGTNQVMISYHGSYRGGLFLYDLSGGGLVKFIDNATNPQFHRYGIAAPVYWDGHVYGHFSYMSTYDQQDRRGLMDVNLVDDSIQYITPTYQAGIDDYKLRSKTPTSDGRLVIGTDGYGIVIYDISAGTWTVYDKSTVSGLPSNNWTRQIIYDPATGNIITGSCWRAGIDWNGLVMFNESGDFRQTKYRVGSFTTEWDFGEEQSLTEGYLDYEMSIVRSDEDELWGVWTRDDQGELSLKWDREEAEIDLTSYITGSVSVEWDVENPGQLNFTLSHGHLFDVHNLMSVLAPVLRKGRQVSLEYGEKIGGIDYYQSQGQFLVLETQTTYQRNTYPTLSVRCEDVTTLWRDADLTATPHYSEAHPEYVLNDIVETFAQLSEDQIDLPADGAMSGSHQITYQCLDSSISDCIQEVLDHFGYFPYVDVDGKFTIKQIDLSGDVTHDYSGYPEMIVNFSPDDSYSTMINRVVVRGEGDYFVEVTFGEEVQISEAGTMGRWGCKETKRHYYDEDREKRCRYPRLNNVENPSVSVFFVEKGGGIVEITDEDPDGYWVDVFIKAPNLIAVFASAVASLIAVGRAAINCDRGAMGTGKCGWYIMMCSVLSSVVMYILAAVANYKYEVWARPIGKEKQTFQATADDYDLQRELGVVLPTELDDPFCNTAALCKVVADRELAIVQAQRNRVTFEKVAHLQDEIGDILRILHPYSGNVMDVFCVNLKRTYTKPEGVGSGGLLDRFEGWHL